MMILTFTFGDIANGILKSISILTPFAIMIIGWFYTKKVKTDEKLEMKRNREREETSLKISEVKKDIANLDKSLSDITSKIKKLTEIVEEDEVNDKIDRILDITEAILFYCMQLGTTVSRVVEGLKTQHPEAKTEINILNEEISKLRRKEEELQQLILHLNHS